MDILKFKPFEELTKEDIEDKLNLHKKEVYNYFGSMKRLTQTKDFNKIK